jgi:hypothetical protein
MNEQFWYDTFGWIGSLLVVGAYALNISGRMRADAPYYLWANIVGSIGLILNTAYVGAYPATCLNVVWVGLGLWGITKSRKKHMGNNNPI